MKPKANLRCFPFILLLSIFICKNNYPVAAAAVATEIKHMVAAGVAIPAVAWQRDIAGAGYKDGAPIGGFGSGSFTWRYDGKFYSRLYPGLNGMQTDDNCGFYMFQKPENGKPIVIRLTADELGPDQATYYALYPKAWVNYYGEAFQCKAVVTQFSPVIPHDYQRTSYPVGIYNWTLSNPTSQTYEVSLMLTWHNPSGSFAEAVNSGNKTGLILRREGALPATKEFELEITLASENSDNVRASYASAAGLDELRADFNKDGALNNRVGTDRIGGIAVTAKLAPGQSVVVPIVITWDMPISFDPYDNPCQWYKRYTRFFGRSGLNSWKIANEALSDYSRWEEAIDRWQTGVLANPRYPDWLKQSLFNELYYLAAGGTVWEAGAASGQVDNEDEDMFSHLECFQYPFYGTSDVRFYGSWALLQNWPEIEKQCVRQFSDSITTNRKDRPAPLGTCAHDFGDPKSIFTKWNAYTFRDTLDWKDLNSKFVLMVYRDWALTGEKDRAFLEYCWPSVKIAMAKVYSQDTDGDTLPNSNGADQTYDDMDLYGNTAYCGGLFLAACQAAAKLALVMGDQELAETYQSWFELGRQNYENKLWTGSYYKIDTGSGKGKNRRIMADQLCGQWYAKACGLPGIVSHGHAVKAYRSIYKNNFKKFCSGKIGPVNVIYPNGKLDTSLLQTQEIWPGVAWSVSAGMLQQGMEKEAEEIGYSVYNTIWNTKALWFRTPEAWCADGTIRAPYYMRATAIWALKHAYDITSLQGGNENVCY